MSAQVTLDVGSYIGKWSLRRFLEKMQQANIGVYLRAKEFGWPPAVVAIEIRRTLKRANDKSQGPGSRVGTPKAARGKRRATGKNQKARRSAGKPTRRTKE